LRTEFETLRLQNAGPFRDLVTVPLKEQGLVSIRGRNLDEGGSNGSGKSSLFEYFYWLLTDSITKTERRVSPKDLVNLHVGKESVTAVDWTRDGKYFYAEKFRKVKGRGTGLLLTEDGVDITPDNPTEAKRKILSSAGMTKDQILGHLYLSQKYIHTMIQGKPSAKKAYLSSYFGLNKFDALLKENQKRINAIPLPNEREITDMMDHVKSEIKALGDVNAAKVRAAEVKENLASLREDQLELRQAIAAVEAAKLVAADRSRWEKYLKSKKISPDRDSIKEFLRKGKAKLLAKKEAVKHCRQYRSLSAELAYLQAEVADRGIVDDPSEELRVIDSRIPALRRRRALQGKLDLTDNLSKVRALNIEKVAAKLDSSKAELLKLQGQLSAVSAELQKLESVDDVCHACLRDISHSAKESMVCNRQTIVSAVEPQIKKLTATVAKYEKYLSDREEVDEIDDELAGITVEGDLDADLARLKELERLSKLYKESRDLINRRDVVQLRLSEMDAPDEGFDVDKVVASFAKMEEVLSTVSDAYDFFVEHGKSSYNEYEHQRLVSTQTQLDSQLQELEEEQLYLQDIVTKFKALRAQEKTLKKSLDRIAEEKQRIRVSNYISVSLGELKKLGLRQSSQLLTDVLPLYLDQMFPKGEISLGVTDDSAGFDLVFNKGGADIPLTLISGGQEKRVGLAIILAFAKLGQHQTNMIIFDEPFRDLDGPGRECAYEIIRDLDISTVFLTSHEVDMQSDRKYDQVWTVEMKDHQSRLIK